MAELTNSLKKKYASLATAKGRREYGLFMAQGTKCVLDTIDHFSVEAVIATAAWLGKYGSRVDIHPVITAKAADIARISTLSTPPEVIAVYAMPEYGAPALKGRIVIALDGVQDPGNLGTIMRVADWMGVSDIIASADTVDVWNPKVVQATMGAVSRVRVHYTDLPEFIGRQNGLDVYGTFLDGTNIYDAALGREGVIVMGNEGNGIRPAVARTVTRRLFIPPYPAGSVTSESLNVAVATAITLSEFRRRM